jgi:hypothetical protein
MAIVRVYVRKKIDGKRNYYPAPPVREGFFINNPRGRTSVVSAGSLRSFSG